MCTILLRSFSGAFQDFFGDHVLMSGGATFISDRLDKVGIEEICFRRLQELVRGQTKAYISIPVQLTAFVASQALRQELMKFNSRRSPPCKYSGHKLAFSNRRDIPGIKTFALEGHKLPLVILDSSKFTQTLGRGILSRTSRLQRANSLLVNRAATVVGEPFYIIQ